MSTTKPNPVVRLLPSLTDVAFLMPLVFLYIRMDGTKYLLGDGDTGWHIRTGDWILQNGRVPDKDIFSFTKAGQPWFAWEWLWDVVFAWLHQHAGMAGVVLVSLLVICFTCALLFRLVRRKSANVLIAIGLTLLATAGTSVHWLARPHLFTLFFTVVFYSILERVRDGNVRLLIALPFLTVLWTNLHGGFFVGIILIGAYAAGEICSWLVETDQQRRAAALARGKNYVLAVLGCGAASLVNPYTYHLHVHMYRFLSGTFQMKYVMEYQAISFQSPAAVWLEAMMLLGAVAAAWSLYKKRFAYVILLVGWTHLGLIATRNIPIFVIVAAPIVGLTLNEFLLLLKNANVAGWLRQTAAAVEEIADEVNATDRWARVHLSSALPVLILAVLLYSPAAAPGLRAEYDAKKYPAKALEVLRGPQFANSIFTHDEWGDYLIYRLYPNTKVFVDGRCDFYGAKFEEKFVDVMNVKYGWQKTLRQYGVDTVLLPVDAPLAGALKESRRWRTTYDDGIAIVFRSAGPEAEMPSRLSKTESEQASVVACNSRNSRDRKVTKSENRDPRITKSNTRSEPL